MLDPHSAPPPATLVESIIRVVDAGHRVVLDRVDLLRFELNRLATGALRGAVMVAAGGFLLAAAWCALMGSAALWLQAFVSLPVSLALVAAASAALGVGAVYVGLRVAQPGSDGPGDGKTAARQP